MHLRLKFFRMSRKPTSRTELARQQGKVPIVKRRGKDGTDMYLSPREPKKPQKKQIAQPQQNPPQAEMLAEEYVHNLQQQLYFLESELRFLRDRSGVNENQEGPSVDSAIRRLRLAMAKHEEETNKRIEELKRMIDEKKKQTNDIDENVATENLNQANLSEHDKIELLKSGFIESASPVHMHQLEQSHYNNVADFQHELEEKMSRDVLEKQAKRESQRDELNKLSTNLDDIRQQRKNMIQKFNDSIRNKRLHEEEADLLAIIGSEEEQIPTTQPISTINAKNAKKENDLELARAEKKEIEERLDRALEESVKLKVEINEMQAKVDRAKKLKEKMEKQFSSKITKTADENDKLKAELAALKASKKEAKQKFADCNAKFDEYLKQVNELQAERQLLSEVIAFKEVEKRKVDAENEKTNASIEQLKDEIGNLQDQLNDISKELAEAAEKLRRVDTLVEMNKKDPRCEMKNPPEQLALLLQSLNSVNNQLD